MLRKFTVCTALSAGLPMAGAVAGIGRAICVGMVVTQRHLDVVKGVGKLPSRSIAAVSVTAKIIKRKACLLYTSDAADE